MSYLVFWSVNAQRQSHFMREDQIKCVNCYYLDVHKRSGRQVARIIVAGRTKYVRDPVVFDESTTPPTLQNDTITNVAYWSKKNPRFPQFYISPVGHIRESASDNIVMEGLPLAERVTEMINADVRAALLKTCSPVTPITL